MIRAALVALLFVCLFAPATEAQSLSRALDLEEVVVLLGIDEPAMVEVFVLEECVSFPLTADNAARLRGVGADDEFLEAISSACFTGAELVVETEPAGAELYVDRQPVGLTPWSGRFGSADDVRIDLVMGDQGYVAELTVEPGKRLIAQMTLDPAEPEPTMRVRSEVLRRPVRNR